MNREVSFHPLAEQELNDAASYYYLVSLKMRGCHCEQREAISGEAAKGRDCFVAALLAMTQQIHAD